MFPFGLFHRAAADGGTFQAEIIDFLVEQGRSPEAGGLDDEIVPVGSFYRRASATGRIARGNGRHDLLAGRDLMHGILRQGDADGVADALGQQRADADGRLDAAFVTAARFGHAQVQRKTAAQLFAHRTVEQAVGFHHDERIAGLERDHDLPEIFFEAHPEPFHHGFLHRQRGVAVAPGDPFAERTVVQADADGRAVLFAQGDQLPELGAGHLVLPGEIARIDAHLVGHGCGGQGSVCQKMDIRHQRRKNAFGTQPLLDDAQRFHLLETLGGEADHAGAGGRHRPALGERRFDVVGRGVAHRLDDDRCAVPDGQASGDGEGDIYHRWKWSEALSMMFWG